ncbi:MAG: galactose-1-phosphate uridylyltransferase [Candidatus Heimdallarchaeaceae archaeon]
MDNSRNSEIRKNPFTGDWIIYSQSRQKRPDRDDDYCPFCAGGEDYNDFSKPKVIPNKYPALDPEVNFHAYRLGPFLEKQTGFGHCQIVVYTQVHNTKFYKLDHEKVLEIFQTWIKATRELKKQQNIQYVLPFENYGAEVGATLLHPHGQLYGFPFIPNEINKEFAKLVEYKHKTGKCMTCVYLAEEQKRKERIIYEDDFILILVPFFAKYAYDIFIYPKRHVSFLEQTTQREKESLAIHLLKAINALNKLFGKEVSYSMSLHQAPINVKHTIVFHLYFKIHTPQRSKESLKLLGAVETSTNTYINGVFPEDAASELRKILNEMG